MKYRVEVDGRELDLEVELRNGCLHAVVGQRAYEAEVARPENGVYLLFMGESVFEVRVSPAGSDSLPTSLPGSSQNSFNVKVGARDFLARVVDRKRRAPAVEHAEEGRQLLTAPMPGKVVRVLLCQGDKVAAGQGVVVVEAMKMQNEVKSLRAGRVSEIRVAEGDTVNANQVLAVVE